MENGFIFVAEDELTLLLELGSGFFLHFKLQS